MKTKLLFLLMLLLGSFGSAFGQTIEIRLSLKVIVDPTTGARPSGITNDLLNTAVTNANAWMANYWRGYRFHLMEIVEIGGPSQGGSSGPSKWFGQYPDGDQFQIETQTDSRYLLRSDQVNFYITGGPVSNAGGFCPIPDNPNNAGSSHTACFAYVDSGPFWLVHETGHFFGLYHTFGGAVCSKTSSPGDDGISDTLPEEDCWTQNQIAMNAFGTSYNNLTGAQQRQVDDTFFDTMSYHNAATKNMVESRLTPLQLDRHADTANGVRNAFVSGRTRFVSTGGSDAGFGSSTSPYHTVSWAALVANPAGGDIILLRPGAYNQALTINKPVTLRATHEGPVAIGTAVAP